MEQKSKAGAFYFAGIGLAVALVGAVFVWLMWNSYKKASATREWTEAPCLVIKSKVGERSAEHISKEYSWSVVYLYEFGGKSFSGDLHTLRGSKWSSRKEEVEAIMKLYPVDEEVVCFVNPEDPAEAILEHDSKAAGYSIWFPMLFVIGGLGIMVSSLKGLNLKLIPC